MSHLSLQGGCKRSVRRPGRCGTFRSPSFGQRVREESSGFFLVGISMRLFAPLIAFAAVLPACNACLHCTEVRCHGDPDAPVQFWVDGIDHYQCKASNTRELLSDMRLGPMVVPGYYIVSERMAPIQPFSVTLIDPATEMVSYYPAILSGPCCLPPFTTCHCENLASDGEITKHFVRTIEETFVCGVHEHGLSVASYSFDLVVKEKTSTPLDAVTTTVTVTCEPDSNKRGYEAVLSVSHAALRVEAESGVVTVVGGESLGVTLDAGEHHVETREYFPDLFRTHLVSRVGPLLVVCDRYSAVSYTVTLARGSDSVVVMCSDSDGAGATVTAPSMQLADKWTAEVFVGTDGLYTSVTVSGGAMIDGWSCGLLEKVVTDSCENVDLDTIGQLETLTTGRIRCDYVPRDFEVTVGSDVPVPYRCDIDENSISLELGAHRRAAEPSSAPATGVVVLGHDLVVSQSDVTVTSTGGSLLLARICGSSGFPGPFCLDICSSSAACQVSHSSPLVVQVAAIGVLFLHGRGTKLGYASLGVPFNILSVFRQLVLPFHRQYISYSFIPSVSVDWGYAELYLRDAVGTSSAQCATTTNCQFASSAPSNARILIEVVLLAAPLFECQTPTASRRTPSGFYGGDFGDCTASGLTSSSYRVTQTSQLLPRPTSSLKGTDGMYLVSTTDTRPKITACLNSQWLSSAACQDVEEPSVGNRYVLGVRESFVRCHPTFTGYVRFTNNEIDPSSYFESPYYQVEVECRGGKVISATTDDDDFYAVSDGVLLGPVDEDHVGIGVIGAGASLVVVDKLSSFVDPNCVSSEVGTACAFGELEGWFDAEVRGTVNVRVFCSNSGTHAVGLYGESTVDGEADVELGTVTCTDGAAVGVSGGAAMAEGSAAHVGELSVDVEKYPFVRVEPIKYSGGALDLFTPAATGVCGTSRACRFAPPAFGSIQDFTLTSRAMEVKCPAGAGAGVGLRVRRELSDGSVDAKTHLCSDAVGGVVSVDVSGLAGDSSVQMSWVVEATTRDALGSGVVPACVVFAAPAAVTDVDATFRGDVAACLGSVGCTVSAMWVVSLEGAVSGGTTDGVCGGGCAASGDGDCSSSGGDDELVGLVVQLPDLHAGGSGGGGVRGGLSVSAAESAVELLVRALAVCRGGGGGATSAEGVMAAFVGRGIGFFIGAGACGGAPGGSGCASVCRAGLRVDESGGGGDYVVRCAPCGGSGGGGAQRQGVGVPVVVCQGSTYVEQQACLRRAACEGVIVSSSASGAGGTRFEGCFVQGGRGESCPTCDGGVDVAAVTRESSSTWWTSGRVVWVCAIAVVASVALACLCCALCVVPLAVRASRRGSGGGKPLEYGGTHFAEPTLVPHLGYGGGVMCPAAPAASALPWGATPAGSGMEVSRASVVQVSRDVPASAMHGGVASVAP